MILTVLFLYSNLILDISSRSTDFYSEGRDFDRNIIIRCDFVRRAGLTLYK